MPFPNKGENHYHGIKNEKQIVGFFNENPTNKINQFIEKQAKSTLLSWAHEGGTQQKKDASFKLSNGEIGGISIKNHEAQGTFDWENTTKGVPDTLKKKILEFKKNNLDKPIPKTGGVRDELANLLSSFLEDLSCLDITNLLERIYKKKEETNYIVINNKKTQELILLYKSNLDPYFNSKHNHEFFLKSSPRAKTSRQIWIRSSDGYEVNTNLRIRLTLNNGINALLGKSKSNKTSVPCLKIQQDNVNEFIKKSFCKVIAKY